MPTTQYFLICAKTLVMLIYYVYVMPFDNVGKNLIMITTEGLTGIAFAYSIKFRRPILD